MPMQGLPQACMHTHLGMRTYEIRYFLRCSPDLAGWRGLKNPDVFELVNGEVIAWFEVLPQAPPLPILHTAAGTATGKICGIHAEVGAELSHSQKPKLDYQAELHGWGCRDGHSRGTIITIL